MAHTPSADEGPRATAESDVTNVKRVKTYRFEENAASPVARDRGGRKGVWAKVVRLTGEHFHLLFRVSRY